MIIAARSYRPMSVVLFSEISIRVIFAVTRTITTLTKSCFVIGVDRQIDRVDLCLIVCLNTFSLFVLLKFLQVCYMSWTDKQRQIQLSGKPETCKNLSLKYATVLGL